MRQIQCDVCDKFYSVRGIHVHKERAHGSEEIKQKYSSGNNGKYSTEEYRQKMTKAAQERKRTLYGDKMLLECVCERCGTNFNKIDFIHLKDKYRFCSRSCANSRTHSKETRQKISNSVAALFPKNITNCLYCQKETKGTKYCNRVCRSNHSHENMDAKKSYRLRCNFSFNLADYSEEFDFDLIKQHGWYKARNRGGDAKSGVSRDHMYSVMDGYYNNIDPEIIKHPANCRLVLQKDNIKKYSKSCTTIEELKQRIQSFESKYTYPK